MWRLSYLEIWQSIFIQKIARMNDKRLSKAAHNLLIECANLKQSDTLLIVREKESLGWYKNDISDFILQCAEEIGIHTSLDEVGSPETNQDQNFYKKNSLKYYLYKTACGREKRLKKLKKVK